MRDTVVRTLSSTITVQNRVRTRTVTGGSAYQWLGGVAYPGRSMALEQPGAGSHQQDGHRRDYAAILPYDTPVQVQDRVVVDGVVYSVSGVMAHTIPVLDPGVLRPGGAGSGRAGRHRPLEPVPADADGAQGAGQEGWSRRRLSSIAG